ncbi:MAG: hypothetical protein WC071_01975 [Victivallaceae bacterium]
MIRLYPLIPLWMIFLSGAATIAIVWFVTRYGMDISPRRRLALGSLRLAAVCIVLIMLLCPGVVVRELNRQRSNVVVMLDGSGSMKTTDMPGDESRYRAARQFLEYLRKTDFSGCKKHFYLFNGMSSPVDWNALEMYDAHGGTDLKRAFATMDKDVGFSRIAAVIVLSDGLDHSGFTGTHAGLPVFAVKFGSELTDVKDLRLETFKYPESLRTNEEFELNVPTMLTGYNQAADVSMTFSVDGETVKTESFKQLPREAHNVNFQHSFITPGIHTVKIVLNQLKDEAGYLNNERELAIEAREGRNETVCYFPRLSNSFRPLVRLLSADNSKFTAFYRLRADSCKTLGRDIDPAFKNGIPKSAGAMKQVDVFILGAGGDEALSNVEQATLEQYTANGGNLIILGGSDFSGAHSASSPLSALMPVKTSKVEFIPGNFRVVAPEQSRNSFSTRIAELTGRNPADLKGINLVDGVKEGAEVLLWAEAESRHPLVVALPYGRGKVIAVLTNSLHLWGQGKERDINFQTFWSQLIAYAGSSRDDILKVTVNSSELMPDENLKVTALPNLPEAEINNPEFKIESEIYPVNSRKAVAFKALFREGMLYSTEFSGLTPGRYMLQTVCRRGATIIDKRYRLILVGDSVNENYDLKVTDENFLKFCQAGRIYNREEKSSLLRDVLNTIQKNDIEREWYPVFETPFFFGTLLALLLAGWYFRRRFNLV